MGRWFILFGMTLVAIGFILHYRAEIPWLTDWIGKLPGDIKIKKGNLTVYVPLATSFLISLVLSLVLSLFFRPSK